MHKMFNNKSGRAMGYSAIIFLIGLGIGVVSGLLQGLGILEFKSLLGIGLSTILVIIGAVVGFMNIESDEAVKMMLIMLVMGVGSGVLAFLGLFGKILSPVFLNMTFLTTPAGVIVAVKTYFDIAKN